MRARKTAGGFLLRVEKGEELLAALTEWARQNEIAAGVLSGIGALEEVTLGFFDRERKEYDKKLFDGEYELVSLNGNISHVEGEPFVHAHCVLGKSDYSLVGGHLFSGTVAVTAEIFVRVLDEKVSREKDPEIGLNLLNL